MAEYYERESLIDALMNYTWWDIDGYEIDDCDAKRAYIEDWLAIAPAANVRPVEKCKWENLVRCGFASVEATCSACGKTLIYKSWWHFCPNCGARVKKEQENK